ncbi:MAG: glycosyltransferase family 4 protein [Bacillota bacterium]
MQERGEQVIVLAGAGGVLFEQLDERKVPYRLLKDLVHPIRPWQDWRALREMRSVLQELQPDLVATHSNKDGLLGRWVARSLGLPVVHTSHGFLFTGREKSAAGRFYRFVEKIFSRLGDRVIVVAESERAAAAALKVIPEEKMVVIHNGLPDIEEQGLADPGAEPPGIVMVARFAAPKDHLTVLKALSGLKELQWSLELVGEGRGRLEAEKLVGELGIGDRVEFLGMRRDVQEILARNQIFVLSSRREGFPLSILEAMRAGLPVVASDAGGVKEAVREGENGFLFPPGDAGRLCEALSELLSKPELRREMGAEGRRRYREYFTLDRMVEETVNLYREIVRCREAETQ